MLSFLFCGTIIGSATAASDAAADDDADDDRFFPTIHFFVETIALLTILSAAFSLADVAPFTTAFPNFCDAVEVAPFTTASATL